MSETNRTDVIEPTHLRILADATGGLFNPLPESVAAAIRARQQPMLQAWADHIDAMILRDVLAMFTPFRNHLRADIGDL